MADEKTEELRRITDSVKEHEAALESLYRKHAEMAGDVAERCYIRFGAHRIGLRPGNMKEAAELLAEVARANLTALCDCASGFQWTTDPEAQALEGCPPRDVWNDLRSVAKGAAQDPGKPGEPIAQDCDCTTSPAAAVESYLSSFGAANADLRHAFNTLRAMCSGDLGEEKSFTGMLREYMRRTSCLETWVTTESAVASKNAPSLPPNFAQVWRPYSPEPALPVGYVADAGGWKKDYDSNSGSVRDWPFRWRIVRKAAAAVDSGASKAPSPEPGAARCPRMQVGITWPDGQTQTWTKPSEAARVVTGHVPNEQFLFDEYRAMANRLRAELDAEKGLTEKLRAELDAERAKAAAAENKK